MLRISAPVGQDQAPRLDNEDLTLVDPEHLGEVLDRLDDEIIERIRARNVLARRIGRARQRQGGTRFRHEAEVATVRRYGQLGAVGRELAVLLLRIGR